MKLIDTNIVLRYLLNDNEKFTKKVAEILLNEDVLVLAQVIAEAIYVLRSTYNVTREEIADMLLDFCQMSSVYIENEKVLLFAIAEYRNSNLDFVDVLLYSHQKHTGMEVITFDRKLQTKLKGLEII